MKKTINLYMDESCHIKNDGFNSMALSTVYTFKYNTKYFYDSIISIKNKHRIGGELKWNKVSNSNIAMYLELIDFLKDSVDKNILRIRILLVDRDKTKIHSNYNVWYYKMVYNLFEKIINGDFSFDNKSKKFNLFLDYKDTHSNHQTMKTAEFLQKKIKNSKVVNGITIDSKESVLIQVADIFAGAATYNHRNLKTSPSKLRLVNHIEDIFNINLLETSPLTKKDFNVFIWRGY